MKALVLCSGGLDSVTLAYRLQEVEACRVDLLNIDYGQRSARQERWSAVKSSIRLNGTLLPLDVSGLGKFLHSSALTNQSLCIPVGEYTQESLAVTIVPNRNAILANIAAGIASSQGYGIVALGVHAGDSLTYPDCRPQFVKALKKLVRIALDSDVPRVLTPFLNLKKWQIVALGAEMGVPFEDTWSCYDNGDLQCGWCSTCTERRQAFELAGVEDPTEYAHERWKDA